MEHNIVRKWMNQHNVDFSGDTVDKLMRYTALIHEANKRFNLTAFHTKIEILEKLVLSSIRPVLNLDVPRGTHFVDIGTGSGVPGVPLAIVLDQSKALLVDSNERRVHFVETVVKSLALENCRVVNERVEVLGRNELFRERWDWVYSRAFGPLYAVIELGSPFLRIGGRLFVYAGNYDGSLMQRIHPCLNQLGLAESGDNEILQGGYLFDKISTLDNRYPRRYAAIKRDMKNV